MFRKSNQTRKAGSALLAAALLASSVLTGCQTTVGGQTLPSGYYLFDDVQYFPAGPEYLLPNQLQALEQYKLEKQGIGNDLDAP
ncbi:MAG: hypothetical protein CMJ78_03340 [Planctomycetaceae bacterium]|nr:hypothetical protein [Planctomycetaceae bacterium]